MTASQLLRDPAILVISSLALLMIVFAPAYNVFSFGEVEKIVIETTLSTVLLACLLVGLLGSIRGVALEIEDRTALVLMSKPLPRLSLVAGKYLGVLAAIVICALPMLVASLCISRIVFLDDEAWTLGRLVNVLGVRLAPGSVPIYAGGAAGVVAAALWFALAGRGRTAGALLLLTLGWLAGGVISGDGGSWRWSVLSAGVLILLEAAVLAAVCSAAAVRLGAAGTILVGVLTLAGGHLRTLVAADSWLTPAGRVPFVALPGLEAFNAVVATAAGVTVPWLYVAWAAIYATIHVLIALLVGGALLQGREVR